MDITIGKYTVQMKADEFTSTTAILQITNKETKERYKGYLNIKTRKQYQEFIADLENDIMPKKFKLYVKPRDVMTAEEIKNVKKMRELR